MKSFIITVAGLSMIFLHIIDDFILQGKLAYLKQKKWWEGNYPDKKYKKDYIICLAHHAYEWSFMIHIPLIFCSFFLESFNTVFLLVSFFGNAVFHLIIDDLKANQLKLNLTQDQWAHLFQMFVTWEVFVIFVL